MNINIVTDTIDLLINNHTNIIHKDAFLHSNQGSQYTSPKLKNVLKNYNLGQYMSRRGNCYRRLYVLL